MPKKQYVSSLKPGETVDDIFVLSEKNLAKKKDGKSYLNLAFTDRTGNLKGVLWDNVESAVEWIAAGDYVQVKGSVSEYRGVLQLVVRTATRSAAEHVEPADFLPVTSRNVGGLLEHTLSMAIIVDKIAGHYTGVDRDLLLAGAILHDIGKIREFMASEDPNAAWTSFHKLLDRHFYMGKKD